ncbi:hypothetical protein [Plantactinospora sp. CA-290183]|uniref:hypothetical protein n=1 Tax=Plantactinospora sp. CA-290183 TaxID=3240006 RepID=UPI003D8AEC2E
MDHGDDGRRLPANRRGWPFWAAVGTVAALLLCTAPVVAGVLLFDRVSGAIDSGAAAPARSPRPGDPATVTRDWLGERMTELLGRQSAALLRGDEAGYLAVADPAAAGGGELARELRRQFRSLRAMRVTQWRVELRGQPVRMEKPGQWQALFTVHHCFVTPDCAPAALTVTTRWADAAGQPRLVAIEPSTADDRPRPWEASDLVVSVGERVLVATTRTYRQRLPELLAQAERAAGVADRYAVDGSPPERYRVFYAGPAEWTRWYGGDRPEWTAGYAVTVGADQYDVVLNSKGLDDSQLDELLRHELTHAASLPGAKQAGGDAWWLIEGVAENAAAGGRPVDRYESLSEVARVLADGDWNGELDDVLPAVDAPDWQVAGTYGIGYLAVRHLVDRYGEPDVLEFFAQVVHEGRPEDEAARQVFGTSWSTLHDDCVAYVREIAG